MLKRELNGPTFESHASARAIVFEYIKVWYNRHRWHSRLSYVGPERFELTQAE